MDIRIKEFVKILMPITTTYLQQRYASGVEDFR
jgi:hypothetical protein